MPRLVLGSSSAFRRALFEEHFPLERSSFRSPDIDENAIRHTDAQTLTRLIANAKADALVEQMLSEDPAADALLICMDQVVVCDGCIREKPTSEAEARRFLASYQAGSKAECVNGCVVHDLKTGQRRAANEIASVSFDSFPESTIDEAIAQGRIYNSSGAFAIDDPLFAPYVTRLEGARDAVIGLPLRTLRRLLDEVSSSSSSAAASSASAGEAADRDDGDARPPPKPVPSQLVPSQLVPGLVLRVLRPDDEAAAVALFASGMHETIISGLRAELVQPCRRAAALSLALLVALGVIARNWVWAMAMQLFGLGMAQAATVTAFKTPSPAHLKIEAAAMPAALGLCFALVCSALVYWLAPQRLASNYVNSCLEDDMKSPYAHYLSSPGSCFWVAIDDASGQVCGTVAVQRASAPWRGAADGTDAELRRMSVASWARGTGVAKALFAELKRFCDQAGYHRVVLETSTLQADAHGRLYPSLGFEPVKVKPLFGNVKSTSFALKLSKTD